MLNIISWPLLSELVNKIDYHLRDSYRAKDKFFFSVDEYKRGLLLALASRELIESL